MSQQELTAALDSAFPDDLDEIIERGLLVYRPILSHAAMATFRRNFVLIKDSTHLEPWHPRGRPLPPVHGIGALTAGQVVLLGGTRPRRVPHTLVTDLSVTLDGGDKESLQQAHHILMHSRAALESLVDHHVVTPVEGRGACTRKLSAFVDLGVAAQIAAMMATLYAEHLGSDGGDLEDAPEYVRRYFLAAIEVFERIKLARRDAAVFREHYLDDPDIEELAEEQGRGLAAEVERRRGFLTRLARALKAEIARTPGAAGREPGSEPEALAARGVPGPRALTRAAGRAAPPRTR